MGIKALKEHFKIKHIVQIENGIICIGSSYIHDIIMIDKDFSVHTSSSLSGNPLLPIYFKELTEASISGDLQKIIESQDEYKDLITVWTTNDGRVIKKQCEVFEWPETTTDGQMIYENTFFKTRKEALSFCRGEAVGFLKGILKYRCRETVRSVIKTLKYTLNAVYYTARAYLFFGH